ncbi:MAG: T9SS type A sorting domain-containing protein [Lentimicrobium sp.]|nr:T9SS type A sorting domain-containing protein [Lentimicrobium sp.]
MKKYLFVACSLAIAVAVNAQIIHVPADQPTIQAGINVSASGDTVLVANGTYLENINFMGKAITVASHFILDADTNHINNTIIDGSQPVYPDSASTVMFIHGEDTTSILLGFTITGGAGMYLPGNDSRLGGGVVCYFSGAKIAHNKIKNNIVNHAFVASGGGIGGFHNSGEMWLIIENNTISENACHAIDNTASGGGIFAACNAIIRNNKIIQNQCTCELLAADGGGVLAVSGLSSPESVSLINNTINFNTLTAADRVRGGGAGILYSHALVSNNSISHNSQTGNIANGSGILFRDAASSILTDNLISNNTVNNGNIYVGTGCLCAMPDGPICIENNEFSDNSGPVEVTTGTGAGLGILDAMSTSVKINANIFSGNNAKSGSGFYSRSCYNMQVSSNLFEGNVAQIGGAVGIYLPVTAGNTFNREPGTDDMKPVFVNNTFVENSATSQGGAVYLNCLLNFPAIYNCIFYQNSSPSGNDISYVQGQEPITVSYSDLNTAGISGVWSGEGNIFEDPIFDSSGPYPFALSPGSPCIDTGTPDTTGLMLPLSDLPGNLRLWDGDGDGTVRIDMGAFEFGSAPVGISGIRILSGAILLSAYPNPFRHKTTIEYQLDETAVVSLKIYNHLGKILKTLVNEPQPKGKHQVHWDSESLPAGIYYCRLQAGKQMSSVKIIKIR